uniref:Anaphase-promoting complex subunit 5 n=1 Tax=Ditylum brightwellii TaxID=49249 RepID=A0A6V2JKU6_9STRA
MRRAVDSVFENARCFDDKISSYFTLVRALGAQGRPQEASDLCIFVLLHLDEAIPVSPNIIDLILSEFLKTRQQLDGKTDDDILSMSAMADGRKIAAMRFLYSLNFQSFFAKTNIQFVVSLRMLQISLHHGLCNDSAFSFAVYGGFLCGKFLNIHDANRFAKLSLLLLDKSESKESLPRIYCVIYGIINPWVGRHRESLNKLIYAYKVGMQYGDILYGMMSAQQYCVQAYESGVELETLIKVISKFRKEMIEHNQELSLKMLLILKQTILNLMGQSKDPLHLSGRAMDEESVLKEAIDNNRKSVVSAIYLNRSWLAYFFGDYELALKMITSLDLALNDTRMPTFTMCNYSFLSALVSFALAHSTDGNCRWMQRASIALDEVKKYAQHAPSNYQHKLLLLEAESAFLTKDKYQAAKKYDFAIKNAGKNGFIQDEALAYERAGHFYFREGNNSAASYHYGKAHSAYLKWGAKAKANYLRENIPL